MLFDLEIYILKVNYSGNLTFSNLHTAGAVDMFTLEVG
jgi:hypothetical protein